MDDAARARAAARDAIDDITPAPLRDRIESRLSDAAMTPGVLTRLAARATGRDYDADELDSRAAGVQLIYDGLQLTRSLARSPPWVDHRDDGASSGDMDVLAADVLVARGFRLLARTDAAWKAVETVRALGRDESNRATGRPHPELDGRTLEADVFELAIVAGTSTAKVEPPPSTARFAADLAQSVDEDLPTVPELLSEPTVAALSQLVADPGQGPAPADRVWAKSPATDP